MAESRRPPILGSSSCAAGSEPLETLYCCPARAMCCCCRGMEWATARFFLPGAYLVEAIEHIYTKSERKGARPHEARLTKAVARVTSLNPAM